MKLVTAVIKPHKWEDVRAALEARRRDRHDRQRGQRLRPAEGPHRGLPRCGVRHRPGAQGPHRDRASTTRTWTRSSRRSWRGGDRPHRRRQGVGLARSRAWCASAPATATSRPSDCAGELAMTARRARAERTRRRADALCATAFDDRGGGARRPASRWSRSAATAARSWRRSATSTSCWSHDHGVETGGAGPGRSGTRSGTPARTSTTRCAPSEEVLDQAAADLRVAHRDARRPAPRRRPQPDPAAAHRGARPVAPRRPRPGSPELRELVSRARDG